MKKVVYALESVNSGHKDSLAYVQELVIPVITLTLEKEVVGAFPLICFDQLRFVLTSPYASGTDLYDTMFSLVDIFTFTMRSIAPKMWAIFEKMHQLFKTTAIDFLDG